MTPTPAILRTLRRCANTAAHNQLALFTPSPALAVFMASTDLRINLRAANRVGKTRHAAAKLATLMLATPGGKYRAVGVTYKQTTRVLSKYLHDFLPPSALSPGCSYSSQNGWTHQLIRLTNGTECQLQTSEQRHQAHAGDDLDGVWIDEIPPPAILTESAARVMSKRGWLWLTHTPVGRPIEYVKTIVEAPDTSWISFLVALSNLNCPWYTRDQVTDWIDEASADPGTYRQRIYGDWEGDTVDRRFTGWHPDITAFSGDPIGKQSYQIGIGIDHGEGVSKQVALFVLWTADCIYVVDEIINTKPTIPDQDAKAIIDRLTVWGFTLAEVRRIVGDTNSAGKASSGRKVNELLSGALHKHAGYARMVTEVESPSKGKSSVEYGEVLINHALLKGTLRVHKRCVGLIRSLRHYAGQEDLKHPIDALRYLVTDLLAARSGLPPRASRLRTR